VRSGKQGILQRTIMARPGRVQQRECTRARKWASSARVVLRRAQSGRTMPRHSARLAGHFHIAGCEVLPQMSATQLRSTAAVLPWIVALFFIWGGLTSLNDVLIPKLKAMFELSYAQAMLTQFAFFAAYLLMSLPSGAYVARRGYLTGMLTGLALMAAGCLLFVPAVAMHEYTAFLFALFVLASGITLLQVAANPFISNLGSSESSHSRLTLAQAFNSLGTTLFPPLGAWLLFGPGIESAGSADSHVISLAYAAIAVALVGVILVLVRFRSVLPHVAAPRVQMGGALGLLRIPRLRGAVTSVFLYVGAEVAIGSILVNFLMQADVMAIDARSAGQLLAFYWGGAMVGRFAGAWILRRFLPGNVLAAFALSAATLVLCAVLLPGPAAGWALLAVGLANSIMFPTLFSLGIEGLGEETSRASGLLCMAIVGGAIIPLLLGIVADNAGIHVSLLLPFACYLAIATYGWLAQRSATASAKSVPS
jgi:MFS transporter, FHS family, L-fucose permease